MASKSPKSETLHSHPLDRLPLLLSDWENGTHDAKKIDVTDLRLLLQQGPVLEYLRCQVNSTTVAPVIAGAAQKAATPTQAQERCEQPVDPIGIELKDCKEHLIAVREDKLTLEKKYQSIQQELAKTQKELAKEKGRFSDLPVLVLLRADQQLAENLGLLPLPQDCIDALTQVVAVLSQRDNLKRLWEFLRERCESERRVVNHVETTLLTAALAWHNYNWKSLPYELVETQAGSRYDYKTQLRSRHVTKGELVEEMLLPGVAEGSGELLCKILVRTK